MLAGFLMTAIPNWTGQMPLSGPPLAALAGLWLAGRLAMLGAGWIGVPLAVAVDALFLPVLVAVCARELIAGSKWKDMKVLGGVALIAARQPRLPCRGAADRHGRRLGAGGGGGLRAAGDDHRRADRAELHPQLAGDAGRRSASRCRSAGRTALAIVAALVALLVWVVAPEGAPAAAAGVAGAGIVFWRLSRWRGLATRAEPLLLVLHVAFGFVGLGFLAIAAGAVGWLPAAGAMHVMLVGGIAGMMLAVMTRATRGHTGQALTASRWTVAAYACLFGGGAGAAGGGPAGRAAAAGGWRACLWIAAFGLFLAEYGPMLLRDRKPRAG